MIGKIKSQESKKENENFEKEIIEKIGAKGIEKGLRPEEIKAGDTILIQSKAVVVNENDIKKDQFNQISVFGKSFPNFQRFVF